MPFDFEQLVFSGDLKPLMPKTSVLPIVSRFEERVMGVCNIVRVDAYPDGGDGPGMVCRSGQLTLPRDGKRIANQLCGLRFVFERRKGRGNYHVCIGFEYEDSFATVFTTLNTGNNRGTARDTAVVNALNALGFNASAR